MHSHLLSGIRASPVTGSYWGGTWAAAQSAYGHLPLSFEANQGHTDCTHSVTRISLTNLNNHGDGQLLSDECTLRTW